MSQADSRHKRIFQGQLKRLAAFFAAGLITIFGGLGIAMNGHNSAVNEYERSQEVAHIYRVMAGTDDPASVRTSERFAVDMRDLIDTEEGTLEERIDSFTAEPNTYGGVDEALGYNPFDNTGQQCDLCGRLSDDMAARLQIIAEGNVEDLIGEELTLTEPSGVSYSPWLIGGALYLLVTSTGALLFAVRKDCKHHGYSQMELNWNNTGGTVADQYKRLSKLLAPGYGLLVRLQNKQGKGFEAALKQVNLHSEYVRLQAMRKQALALPGGEDNDLVYQLDDMLRSIEEQIADFGRGDRKFEAASADALRRELETQLADIAISVQARKDSRAELEAHGF